MVKNNKIIYFLLLFLLTLINLLIIRDFILSVLIMTMTYILVVPFFRTNSTRENIFLILLSLMVIFLQVIGYNCSIYDSARLNYLVTYAYISKFFPIVFVVFNFLWHLKFCPTINKNKIVEVLFNRKYSIFLLTCILFLSWLPILIAFYPGNFSYDVSTQLRMINFNEFTKHHPVIHTLFIYITIEAGNKIFLSYDIGILIHSIAQMLIMAFIFSYTLVFLYKNKFSYKINIFFLFIYMFLPIHSMFSITTTKDVIFSGLFNLAIIKIIDLLFHTDQFLSKKNKQISLVIIFFLLLSFRSNMIEAYILFLPCIYIVLRKYFKKIFLLFLCPLLIYIVYDVSLTKSFKIPNSPKAEQYSIIAQQLARVYNYEQIGDIDKENIERLYYDNALDYYNSHISDPVKNKFNTDEFLSNRKKYVNLYLKLGTTYPLTYIDSIFDNLYSFFYIGDILPDLGSKTFIEISCLDYDNVFYERTIVCNKNIVPIYDLYYNLLNNATYQKDPILNIMMNMGVYLMIVLFVSFYTVAMRKYQLFAPIWLLLCYLFTTISAPVAIVRYVYPLFTCMPLIIYLFFANKQSLFKNI